MDIGVTQVTGAEAAGARVSPSPGQQLPANDDVHLQWAGGVQREDLQVSNADHVGSDKICMLCLQFACCLEHHYTMYSP